MKIALIQQHAARDKTDNIRRGLAALDEAAARGADVAVFAELAFERFYPQQPAGADAHALAETIPGPMTDAFAERARRYGIVVVLNLYERDGNQAPAFIGFPLVERAIGI